MGEVVELGAEVANVAIGDRVVVPFTIACRSCFFCRKDLWSLCDNSNPNARQAEQLYHQLAPELFAGIAQLVNSLLPAAGGIDRQQRLGSQSTSAWSPSWLTVLNEQASRQHNQGSPARHFANAHD